MDIIAEVKKVKQFAPELAASRAEQRNQVLSLMAELLRSRRSEILEANHRDMEAAEAAGLARPVLGRLKLDAAKLDGLVQGLQDLTAMPDPLGKLRLERELDEGLCLYQESCPIGVIGVIFEARPDALVQISALCIKSGNCVILKGGSEAAHSNRLLASLFTEALTRAGLPARCLLQLEGREEIRTLLSCHRELDLLVPRGSNAFVQYIMENTKIPVMGHADGICHIYVDRAADQAMALPVIVDAKTQYVSACNTVETLLVHRDIAAEFLPKLKAAMDAASVTLRGTEEVRALIDCEAATEADFETEYLDYILSVALVEDVSEAIGHINRYGSHHTDSILTEDDEAAAQFMSRVDSAGVYRNCSTRFADGYRYGFGAELGISTGKLHARGPVGLEGLLSYKYKLEGHGHIVGDYASGKRHFHFKDKK